MVFEAGFEHRFHVPWEHATTAHWCKYPSPDLPHVKDALVLHREVRDGKLYSTRLMHTKQALPKILQPFSGGLDSYFAIERSEVDPVKKVMTLRTRNLTFETILVADETCVYRASEDFEGETDYNWSVACHCIRRIPFVSPKVEIALVEKAKGNSSAGMVKMDKLTKTVSKRWKTQGRPSIERWPTANRFLSRRFSVRLSESGLGEDDGPKRWRRYIIAGPRKSVFESKLNPFGAGKQPPGGS